MSYIRVTMKTGIVQEDDILLLSFKTEHYTTSHTIRYHNSMSRLVHCSACARYLIEFLAEIMEDDCMVATNLITFRKFHDFMKEVSGGRIEYSSQTIKEAFMELRKQGLIIRGIRRGLAWVNPVFFFKGSEGQRKKRILEIQEEIIQHRGRP